MGEHLQRSTEASASGTAGPQQPARELCLFPAPGAPEVVARELARRLPDRLDGGPWRVGVEHGDLLAEGFGELADAARSTRRRADADLVVCLTDVPLRTGQRPLAAAFDAEEGIGVVSVPAVGAVLLRRRVQRTAEAVVAELAAKERPVADGPPLTRPVEVPDGHGLSRGYALPAGLGHVRLLAGMVRANRPWRTFRGLSSAVIAALATGAYAVINSMVWQLSSALSTLRLLAAMLIGLTIVVGWLIVAHDLWEGSDDGRPTEKRRLYNAATLLTLSVAVVCAYVVLFVVLLAISALLIDGGVFRSTTQQPADLASYLELAWLGTSIATVAGALGSGLEKLDEVRDAVYGHDQRRRRQQ